MVLRLSSFISGMLLAVSSAVAAPASIGSLSRADGSSVIVDSLNQREWLGWDVVRTKDYTATLTAIAEGGVWSGFKIARNVDAQMFVTAMLGATPMSATDYYNFLYFENNALGTLVGESGGNSANPAGDEDNVFFLSDNNRGEAVGYIRAYTGNTERDYVAKDNEWGSVALANSLANSVDSRTGWLLYRDISATSNTVPEPSSWALAMASLFGAVAARRSRKSLVA